MRSTAHDAVRQALGTFSEKSVLKLQGSGSWGRQARAEARTLHSYFLGTSRFSSSSQFWTSTTCEIGGCGTGSLCWIIRKRRPSGMTS
jgi:hypothetical protein